MRNSMLTSYRTLRRVIVRRQPSFFADELRRLGRGHVFTGWPHVDRAWVVRLAGGFVARKQVETV